MTAPTLLVVAKAPVPGRVKTRLCPPCSPHEAAEIAEAALADTLELIASCPARRRVVVLDGAPGPWLPRGFDVIPQIDGPFANRLAAAFDAIAGPAFLVGMDTPQLQKQQVAAAVHALHQPNVDAVLGPASDGGWWGLGMQAPTGCVFDGVPMSTSQTVAFQLRRMAALGLQTTVLDVLRDVDNFGDAEAAARCVPGSGFAEVVKRVSAAKSALELVR